MIRELDFWHLASAYVSTMSSPVLVLAFRFGLSIVFSFGELLLSHYHKVFSSSQGTIIVALPQFWQPGYAVGIWPQLGVEAV